MRGLFDQPLTFLPIYQSRVWGGTAFETLLNRQPPKGGPFGEAWELVDRPEAQSLVAEGPWAGTSLHELWTAHREAVFGNSFPDSERFPLLIKLLDARESLSVQVHPTEAASNEGLGEPKTEAWILLDTQPDAAVYAGFRAGVNRAHFESALTSGHVEPLLHRVPVQSGDVLFIPSGRCHAIGGGCLLAEVQQNSDTTYRVYDWGRLGLDGRPRELHLDQSLRCINFEDIEPGLVPVDSEPLVNCPFFQLERWTLNEPRLTVGHGSATQGAFFLIESGRVRCGNSEFERGACFWLPAAIAAETPLAPLRGDAQVLRFSHGA
jgi:mannose-6-phosphate isomerase